MREEDDHMTFYEKCQERTSRLMDFAINANQSYMLILIIRDLQANKNEIANISPAFYQSVFRACLQILFIDVSKMFDDKKKNESTLNLLSDMQKNQAQLENIGVIANHFRHLGDMKSYPFSCDNLQDILYKCMQLIAQNEDDIKSLRKLRNKYYAHLDRDSQNDLDKLFRENKVSLAAIERLLTLSINILNTLYMYFNNSTVFPVTTNHDDFKKTVWFVEQYDELYHKMQE